MLNDPRRRFCWFYPSLLTLAAALLLTLLPATALNMTRLQDALRRMNGTPQAFIDWKNLLHENEAAPTLEKLRRVNEFFNRRIEFSEDQQTWRQSDYWATPVETLAKGKGDCEDYVIAKYFTLRNLQIPDDQLRLIYAKARIGGPLSNIELAHMVLAYYASPDAEPLILDNLITEIRPAARRPDLQPVFSFNGKGVFAGVDSGAARGQRGPAQLSRWQDLLQRALAEGFD